MIFQINTNLRTQLRASEALTANFPAAQQKLYEGDSQGQQLVDAVPTLAAGTLGVESALILDKVCFSGVITGTGLFSGGMVLVHTDVSILDSGFSAVVKVLDRFGQIQEGNGIRAEQGPYDRTAGNKASLLLFFILRVPLTT